MCCAGAAYASTRGQVSHRERTKSTESSGLEVACRLQPRSACHAGRQTIMGARRWAHWLFAALACALLATPAAAQNNAAFERGYREGIQHGADDGRNGRQFEPQRDSVYRDGDRGYNSRYGNRDGTATSSARLRVRLSRGLLQRARQQPLPARQPDIWDVATDQAGRLDERGYQDRPSRADTATDGRRASTRPRPRPLRSSPPRRLQGRRQRLRAQLRIEGRLREQLSLGLPPGVQAGYRDRGTYRR